MTMIAMTNHSVWRKRGDSAYRASDANRSNFLRLRASLRQAGLSLVELMVALLISSLILIGLVQIFASTRVTYQADEGLARLQENGRFAMDFLARDIRMAGNMGCIGKIPAAKQAERVWNYLDTTSSGYGSGYNLSTGISGFEMPGTSPGANYALPSQYPPAMTTGTTPALDTTLVSSVAVGSDVVTVRYMDSNATPLVPNASGKYHDSAQVFAGVPNTLKQYQIAMVTNCKQVAIFQITNNPTGGAPVSVAHGNGGTPGNTCPNWGTGGCKGYDNAFGAGSQIATLRSVAFFIGRGANNGPALFRQEITSPATPAAELVEGIENMQILYGIDTNPQNNFQTNGHQADSYLTANLVADWSQVISVRIGLLVSTSNVVGQADTALDTSTYTAAGVTIDPAVDDRRRRRVFTSTVSLRVQ